MLLYYFITIASLGPDGSSCRQDNQKEHAKTFRKENNFARELVGNPGTNPAFPFYSSLVFTLVGGQIPSMAPDLRSSHWLSL